VASDVSFFHREEAATTNCTVDNIVHHVHSPFGRTAGVQDRSRQLIKKTKHVKWKIVQFTVTISNLKK